MLFTCLFMKSTYHLIEVNDKITAREFIRLPVAMYAGDPNWIRPLDKDVEEVFDPAQNKAFRHGECIRWILKEAGGNTIGRVAAFYDEKKAKKNEQPTAGMGFFECINNQEAANILFQACVDWLKEKGMEAVDGPVNFGERDRWWGLLVDGFYPPNYQANFNFPYYKQLFETFGFKNYFEQYTYYTPMTDKGLNPGIREKAIRLSRDPNYRVENVGTRQSEKFATDFVEIYNKAWTRHGGVKKITRMHAKGMFKSMKPILDKRLILFGYYKDEPIAFFIMLPEINQIIMHLNGKMNLIGKLKFKYYQLTNSITKAFGVIFGVIPAYQAKGVEGLLIMAFAKIIMSKDLPYKDLELNWIGDFNPSMMKIAEQIGARIHKTHVTYRYLFDRTKEFKRAKSL